MEIEARAAVLVRHPHLVDTTDFDTTTDGRPFLVMELLEGGDLRAEITRLGQLSLRDAVRYLRETAEALAGAHEQGVVHRDLKPENIFLHQLSSGPRTVKVLDLGLAKIVDLGRRQNAKTRLCPTEKDMFVGTPEYVAPEQLLGRPVDHRADIYAMGVVLYELITGVRPFAQATDPTGACLELVPAPPSKRRRGIPRTLDRIVMKALERDPANRFQAALELERALARTERHLVEQRMDWRVVGASTLGFGVATFSLLELLLGSR
jgi:serine/threonine-protein kinase